MVNHCPLPLELIVTMPDAVQSKQHATLAGCVKIIFSEQATTFGSTVRWVHINCSINSEKKLPVCIHGLVLISIVLFTVQNISLVGLSDLFSTTREN